MIYKRGLLSISGVDGVYTCTYTGKGISNNAFYAGGGGSFGWRKRYSLSQKYHKIFRTLLGQSDIQKIDRYVSILWFNCRYDCDNTVAMQKLMLDALKEIKKEGIILQEGWVTEDSKKFLKGTLQMYDPDLPKDTFEFVTLHLK